MPLRTLSAGLVQDPLADRDDQAAGFEGRDEVVGLHDPPLRVSPSQERLHADEGAGGELDGWLVQEKELAVVEGMVQVDFDGSVVVDGFLHRRGEGHRAVLAGWPWPDRGRCRRREEAPRAATRSPSAMPMLAVTSKGTSLAEIENGGGQDVADPLRHHLRPGGQGGAFDEHDELVTSEPAHRVPFTECAGQSGGDTGQQLVARLVAQGVVDVLEVVEVEEERRQPGCAGDGRVPASARPG